MAKLPTNKSLYEQAVREGKVKPKPKKAPTAVNPQWWTAGDEDLPGAVMAHCVAIAQAEQPRIRDYNVFTRLYGGQEGVDASKINASTAPSKERMGFNIVSTGIDTLVSKMAKARPKPYFQTIGGNSKIVRKAKKLDKFAGGVFYDNQAYMAMPLCFRDAAVYGTGILWVGAVDGRVRWERVQPWEVLVDYLECLHGPEFAKSLHRVRDVDRTTLATRYPEHADAIRAANNVNTMLYGTERSVADTVTVVESWRLPSSEGGDDGVYCVTLDNVVLDVDRKYAKDHFPFAVMRYSPRLQGWYGQGAAEQLLPIQFELNQCLMTVQRSFWLGGTHKVLVHEGSKVVPGHFDGNVGTIIKWAGTVAPN